MTLRQFVVPTDDEVVDALGVEPEPFGLDAITRVVRIPYDAGDVLILSYDAPGCSVGLKLYREQKLLLDIYREGAESLRVFSAKSSAYAVVEFKTESTIGKLEIQIFPEPEIRESSLLA